MGIGAIYDEAERSNALPIGVIPQIIGKEAVSAVEESVESEVTKIKKELEGALPEGGLPAPPTPEDASEESDKAVMKERRRAGRRGRASTLLTGGRGLEKDEGSTSRRTLLGA